MLNPTLAPSNRARLRESASQKQGVALPLSVHLEEGKGVRQQLARALSENLQVWKAHPPPTPPPTHTHACACARASTPTRNPSVPHLSPLFNTCRR